MPLRAVFGILVKPGMQATRCVVSVHCSSLAALFEVPTFLVMEPLAAALHVPNRSLDEALRQVHGRAAESCQVLLAEFTGRMSSVASCSTLPRSFDTLLHWVMRLPSANYRQGRHQRSPLASAPRILTRLAGKLRPTTEERVKSMARLVPDCTIQEVSIIMQLQRSYG